MNIYGPTVAVHGQVERWLHMPVTEDLIRQVQTDIHVGLKNRYVTEAQARDAVLHYICEVTKLIMTATNPPMEPK